MLALQVIPGMLQQISVFHSARAGSLTGAATKAKIYVPHRGVVDWCAASLHSAHEIYTATRRIVFIACFQIRGTRRKAKATVNTGKRFFFINERLAHNAGRIPLGSNNSLIRCSTAECIRSGAVPG